MFDVIVIGGGVIGCSILDTLQKYNTKCLLLEKYDDVSCGASRANSGIVHAGYDCVPNTLKAELNVKGCKMMKQVAEELHVPYVNTGSLVVTTKNGKAGIEELYNKGIQNGVDVEIIGRDRILEIEPNIADDIELALYAKDAGIVSPYKLTIAYCDHAILNGAEVKVGEEVVDVKKNGDVFTVSTATGNSYEAKVVINCAGAGSMKLNNAIGAEVYDEVFRRGDYFVLDQQEKANVNTVIFPLPDEKGKGILVAPTADGNVIYGPTSVVIEDGEDKSVSSEGLDQIRAGVSKTFKKPNYRKVIRLYAGVRHVVGDDFVIEFSKKIENFITVTGICSPGLTSAPAIGEKVADMVGTIIKLDKKDTLVENPEHPRFVNLSTEELNEKVKQDPKWGRLICRCEKVTEAEIVAAIHQPLPAKSVDAVKRRTRAGMGRCQGGFCGPRVIEIIARELNIPITSVKKDNGNSEIAIGKLKEIEYEIWCLRNWRWSCRNGCSTRSS